MTATFLAGLLVATSAAADSAESAVSPRLATVEVTSPSIEVDIDAITAGLLSNEEPATKTGFVQAAPKLALRGTQGPLLAVEKGSDITVERALELVPPARSSVALAVSPMKIDGLDASLLSKRGGR